MTSATIHETRRLAELEHRYPSWHLWLTDRGNPCATRRGDHKDYPLAARRKADWEFTLISTWEEIEIKLAQQAELDETGPSWNIFAGAEL